ncbi:MAG: DUF5126 domain-containing protein [Prevotellaceae bacterium]|nr:DUF5126 domain-containing protein [Prevotellaceae bacterium]
MKKLFYIIIVTIMAGMASCTEPPTGQTPVDGVPPSQIAESSIQIYPMPGGAAVTYDLPAGENDISYVKCEYTYKGEKYVVHSSVYTDSLTIEGLGDTDPVEITLYVVDNSGNVSPGVAKTFTPENPLWEAIFESLEIQPSFGGVAVTWTNRSQTEIGITVFTEDSITKELREGDTRYSNEQEGEIPFNGYDFVPTKFAARIIDKWGNVSPVKEATVVPLYEAELNKDKWLEVGLPGDHINASRGRTLKNCWDGDDGSIWHTEEGGYYGSFPMFFTIDLGEVVKFSRMRLMPRQGANYYFGSHTFREFEVWGTTKYRTDVTDEDYWRFTDDWEKYGDWELLGHFEVKRPSGNPNPGAATGEDLAFGQAGYPFSVSYQKKPLQYLRFKMIRTWGSGGMHMAEFYFWGDNGTLPEDNE